MSYLSEVSMWFKDEITDGIERKKETRTCIVKRLIMIVINKSQN